MALVVCPECGRKNVSDLAEACPSCGFGLKEYFLQVKKIEAEKKEYERMHKKVILSDSDLCALFESYEFALNKFVEKQKVLESEFRYIRFDYDFKIPLQFSNKLFDLLCDTYTEIYLYIHNVLKSVENEDVQENIARNPGYNPAEMIRGVLGAKYFTPINAAIDSQNEVALREAEVQYQREVAEKGSMPYGIITNSGASMAFYAFEAAMKKVKAETDAQKNKDLYINRQLSTVQSAVYRIWKENFDEVFLPDMKLLDKTFLTELDVVFFNGLELSWDWVDEQYNDKKYASVKESARKTAVERSIKKAEDEYIRQQEKIKEMEETRKRGEEADQKLKEEYYANVKRLDRMGIALWGKRAAERKQLESRNEHIAEIRRGIKQYREAIGTVNTVVGEHVLIKICENAKIVFERRLNKYKLICSDGLFVATFPEGFTYVYGPARAFVCNIEGYSGTKDGMYEYEFRFH